jgi:hypothetical protein
MCKASLEFENSVAQRLDFVVSHFSIVIYFEGHAFGFFCAIISSKHTDRFSNFKCESNMLFTTRLTFIR